MLIVLQSYLKLTIQSSELVGDSINIFILIDQELLSFLKRYLNVKAY
jgi:hypothetical protein